jgi:hypothetical protein
LVGWNDLQWLCQAALSLPGLNGALHSTHTRPPVIGSLRTACSKRSARREGAAMTAKNAAAAVGFVAQSKSEINKH